MEAKYLISVESKRFADVRPNIVLFDLPRIPYHQPNPYSAQQLSWVSR